MFEALKQVLGKTVDIIAYNFIIVLLLYSISVAVLFN